MSEFLAGFAVATGVWVLALAFFNSYCMDQDSKRWQDEVRQFHEREARWQQRQRHEQELEQAQAVTKRASYSHIISLA